MLVNRKDEAICSETVILGMMLDGFVNLVMFLQPPDWIAWCHCTDYPVLASSWYWRRIRKALRPRSRADRLGCFSWALRKWLLRTLALYLQQAVVLKTRLTSYTMRQSTRDTAVQCTH